MDEDGGATGDAGADADADGGGPTELPAEPMAPAAAASIVRPCPDGWSQTESGCLPFDVEPACTGAETAIPGVSACVAIGSACPSGEFAVPPDTGEVIYVSARATAPGDGSLSAPYDRLSRAIARATSGTTVLLSKGAHVGETTLADGVHLRGACAAETSLSSALPDPRLPTLLVDAGDAQISDLTLDGERPGLFAIGTGARATLRGVIIEGVPGLGILAQGGAIDAEEVIIRDVRAVGGMAGRGADAVRGGSLEIRRSMIEATEGGGMLLGSEAQATIRDVVFRDLPSRAVSAQTGADVHIERVAMLRVGNVALNANNEGTTLTVSDLLIDGVTAADGRGRGISIGDGASLDAAGVAMTNIEEHCLFATDPGSTAVIEDAFLTQAGGRGLNGQRSAALSASRVFLRDLLDVSVLASSEASVTVRDAVIVGGGRALRAQTGSSLLAERVQVSAIIGDAVQSSHEGTTVVVEDLDVQDSRTGPDNVTARGAAAFSGSHLTLRRALLADAIWSGVSVFDESTSALIEDVRIVGVLSYHDGSAGFGLSVLAGSLEAHRVRIRDAHTMGIGMAHGARVIAHDIAVSSTFEETSSGLWGRAVSAEGPADHFAVERGVFEGSIAAGVFAGGEGTVFDMTDVIIRTTAQRDCASGDCVEEGGIGLVSFYGAAVRLESFVVSDNAVAGAQLGEGGEIDFVDGEVRNQPIGVSIQTLGYDVNRLTERVHYIDNGANLDAEGLPVPSNLAPSITSDEPPED